MFAKLIKSIGLSVVFIMIFAAIPAQSASIAGTKCTNLNSIKVVANSKYTCIKSGKKLIWNNGIKIKTPSQPAPSKSPEPTSTPTQTKNLETTPTPTPSAIETLTNITPGAFCRPDGALGTSSKGVLYTCKTSPTDSRSRWRQ